MNQNIDQLIYIVWAVLALVALSGIYPARKLYASTKRTARTAFFIITGLSAVAPLLFLAYDQLRLLRVHEQIRNNSSILYNSMPFLPMDQLPYVYVLSVAIAALFFWLTFAWHCRTAA
jgi:hypothetical protein